MKHRLMTHKHFIYKTLMAFILACLSFASYAAVEKQSSNSNTSEWMALSEEVVKTKLGRELRFSERIGLRLAQRQVNRIVKEFNSDIPPEQMVHWTSIVSFILAVGVIILLFTTSLLIAAYFSTIPLVFGFVGLIQQRRNPEKYKDKWFPVIAIMLSALPLFVLLLAIALLAMIFSAL